MECNIYKGKRKPDHYLFMPADKPVKDIPDSIQQMLGEIEYVMNIDITEESKLAQSDPVTIINMISEKGFFIQIPPKNEVDIDTKEY